MLRHGAAILSDFIINENLKLLQINYLAQKVDVLFDFPSRSHCACNRTYGKTVYNVTDVIVMIIVFKFVTLQKYYIQHCPLCARTNHISVRKYCLV